MKLKTGLIFVLSLLLICFTLVSCKKEEEPPAEDGGDDYTGSIAPEDGSGSTGGTEPETPVDEGDPNATYEIFTADDLKTKLKMKGTYVLKANIDLGGAEWTPVGTAKHPFAGTFDGGAFTVSNFKITVAPTVSEGDVSLAFKYAYSGFFGVTENATVKDVTFDAVTINTVLTADNVFLYAGTVAGYSVNTSFSNITVTNSSLTSQSKEYITCVGGLVGYMQKGSLTKCNLNVTVSAKESLADATAGGLVGQTSETEITACSSNGAVSSIAKYGKSYAGGLVGLCSSSKISKCVSASTVHATVSSSSAQTGKKGSASAGGFAAIVTASSFNKRTEISNSYTADTCSVTAVGNKNAAYAGGFAASSEYGIYKHCYSRSPIKVESNGDAAYAAGLIAYLYNQEDSKNPETKPYPYDTRIEGCFYVGSITVRTTTNAYFLGTLTYCDLPVENEEPIVSGGYHQGLNFYINSDTPDNSNAKINKNGSEITSAVYSNMAILKENYGFSADVWEIKSGESFPTLKPVV